MTIYRTEKKRKQLNRKKCIKGHQNSSKVTFCYVPAVKNIKKCKKIKTQYFCKFCYFVL